ncbi:MAG: aspartate carbamoyltransferase [Aigarchaeota archaeon]|jgi:aspartate carbamoyltransferase catalytic subunit|nr:aspartate carbamoyltransferase [Candidatus Wolframiiraptor gerlachensis]
MLRGRDIISVSDLSRQDFEEIFRMADEILEAPERWSSALRGRIMATAFFEPSTRTRLSFQTAMLRLGGEVIDLGEVEKSSIAKGENFSDTVRMLDSYADVIVIRHKLEGAAKLAAEIAEKPVINAGDGSRNHPTQAMIDLYTIRRLHGGVDGLTIGVLGDLKYGRATNSFIAALTKFRIGRLYLISPPQLRVRDDTRELLVEAGIDFKEVQRLEEVVGELDVLYASRIQRERFPDPSEYEMVRGSYVITGESLKGAKKNLTILHPLPRVNEISFEVDSTSHAKYFEQAALGVPVRMALLKLILVG